MKRTKILCELCNREISRSNYARHLKSHENHPEKFKKIWKLNHDGLNCQYCGKECKNRNSLCNHERLCKNNPNRQISYLVNYSKTHDTWNKGLTKETDERLRKRGESLHNRYVNGELIAYNLGKHLTQDEKDHLSRKRKEFLSKNPDKVPYIINHSSKMSYPEKYFIELFNKEGIELKYHHRINKYELDFCNLNSKLDIEIDGDQHYLDKRIHQSDIERDEYLTKLGWKILRIRWSDYQKLSMDKKKEIIEQIRASLA